MTLEDGTISPHCRLLFKGVTPSPLVARCLPAKNVNHESQIQAHSQLHECARPIVSLEARIWRLSKDDKSTRRRGLSFFREKPTSFVRQYQLSQPSFVHSTKCYNAKGATAMAKLEHKSMRDEQPVIPGRLLCLTSRRCYQSGASGSEEVLQLSVNNAPYVHFRMKRPSVSK